MFFYENFVVHQTICLLPCKMMICVILITSLLGIVLVLWGEIWYWPLKLKRKQNIRFNVQYGNYISILLAFKYSVHMNLLGHSVVKCVPIYNVKTLSCNILQSLFTEVCILPDTCEYFFVTWLTWFGPYFKCEAYLHLLVQCPDRVIFQMNVNAVSLIKNKYLVVLL